MFVRNVVTVSGSYVLLRINRKKARMVDYLEVIGVVIGKGENRGISNARWNRVLVNCPVQSLLFCLSV